METKKKYAVGAIIGLELYLSDKIKQEVNDAIYKKLDETTED